jgi:hypothetical protein
MALWAALAILPEYPYKLERHLENAAPMIFLACIA